MGVGVKPDLRGHLSGLRQADKPTEKTGLPQMPTESFP